MNYINNNKIQIVFICALVILLNIFDISTGELFYNNDEPRHAFNGVFVHDLIRDMPSDPVQYAYEYYAQYPALSVLHWPPFFYVVESIFYSLFGISVESGRLAVMFFALIGIIFWYRLILKMHNMNVALFSSVLLISAPPVVFFSKMIMLEIPLLALSIMSIYYFYSYFDEGKRKDVYLCSISLALAILTKQNAIFIPLLYIAYIIVERKYDVLKNKDVMASIGIFAVLVIPYNLFVLYHTYGSISKDLLQGTTSNAGAMNSIDTYLYYLRVLPGQIGWIMLTVFIASVIQLIFRGKRNKNSLFLIWILVCYTVFTLIHQKDPRYIICWIPPILLLAVLFIDSFQLKIKKLSLSVIILVAVSAVQITTALSMEKPYIRGYEKVAKLVLEKANNGVLFIDDYFDANFIFFVRKHDKERKTIVLRGSKVLFTTNIFPEYDIRHIVRTEREIENFIEDYGIKYILVEDNIVKGFKINTILRNLLQDRDKFNLLDINKIDTNMARYGNRNIHIYENIRDVKRLKDKITLKMLTLGGKEITLDLKENARNKR